MLKLMKPINKIKSEIITLLKITEKTEEHLKKNLIKQICQLFATRFPLMNVSSQLI